MNISEDNFEIVNPADSTRNVIFSYDFVHVYKNLRNHIIDDVMKLKNGTVVSKKDLNDLRSKISSEITCGFRLTDLHFDCKGTDRQSVRLARQLLSKSVGVMLKKDVFFQSR